MLCKNWKWPFEECLWASSSSCEHIYSYQLLEKGSSQTKFQVKRILESSYFLRIWGLQPPFENLIKMPVPIPELWTKHFNKNLRAGPCAQVKVPLVLQLKKIRLWHLKQNMSQRELVADPGQELRFPVTHHLPETLSGDPCVSRWGTKVGNRTLWKGRPRSQEPMVGGRGSSPRSPRRLRTGHHSRFLGHSTPPVSSEAKTKELYIKAVKL